MYGCTACTAIAATAGGLDTAHWLDVGAVEPWLHEQVPSCVNQHPNSLLLREGMHHLLGTSLYNHFAQHLFNGQKNGVILA